MPNHPPGALLLPYLDHRPELAASAWVAPGAQLIGDVQLGEEVSIWYGCVLRGDVERIRVGDRTNIQDLCVLHVTRDRFSTEVGAEVTIGHRAVVHGCQVGDGALIGIGSVVLDGATIGEEAWVGAGALVAPGASIPPRMLALGTPARPVRQLSADELALQRERTLSYVALAKEHASSLAADRSRSEP